MILMWPTLARGLALLLAVSTANPAYGSNAEERDLGRQFDLQARARFPLINDVEVNQYVAAIGQKIVAGLEGPAFEYHFTVVRDARLNAFAVPGGYVYVHGGLLIRANSDDEIAGVLGHEIAHVHAHHLVRQQEATQLLSYAALLGTLLAAIQPMAAVGAAAIHSATQLQYRREFEQEADYLGARYMQKAGYNPRGMLDFFQTMLADQNLAPAMAPPYLLSHPLTQQRLTNLEAVLKLPPAPTAARHPPGLALERVQLLTRARSQTAEEVVTHYRRRLEAQPEDTLSRYLMACAFFETGALEAARGTFRQSRQPGFASSERELGRIAFAQRDYPEAHRLLSNAVAVAPRDAVAHFELGRTLEALNETSAAMGGYRRAVDLVPEFEEAHYNLGILSGRNGHESEGFYHLGMAHYLRGEHGKALIQLEKAAALLPPATRERKDAERLLATLKEYLGH